MLAANNGEDQWYSVASEARQLIDHWCDVDLSLSRRGIAARLGLSNSESVDRWLRSRRLPPYGLFRDWYYVVRLVEIAGETTLAKWALSQGRDPAVYYRFVERVVRAPWKDVRGRGVAWVRRRALDVWNPYLQGEI